MKATHIAVALGLTIVWGLNFVVLRFGLDHVPPLLFAMLRFLVAAVPALVVPRPRLPLSRMMGISLAMFVAQYVFLYEAMQVGYPAGLASLTLQMQSFFTVLMAAVFIGERPGWRSLMGLAIALAGLAAIASTVGTGGVTLAGFLLMMLSALGWATGNVIIRSSPRVDMFPLISWTSALAILPLLVLSLIFEGPDADWAALAGMNWVALGSLAYVAIPTTILGFFIWGKLLSLYPTSQVAPFALMVPVTGTLSAYLILGESFGPVRLVGMGLILLGIAVNSLPVERLWRRR